MILIAGGLAALALVPSASIGWTLAPQALIGAGLALTLPGLTGDALTGVGLAGDPRRLDDRRPPRRASSSAS